MTLMEKMARKFTGMTETEKRIYDLILKDVKAFSLKPIGEVAESLDISKTTLMRFGKSLGFKGYADFKKTLQEEALLDVSPARKIKHAMSLGHILNPDDIRAQEVANINAMFDTLDLSHLNLLVDRIIASDTVSSMAWGISSHLADIMTWRLKMAGKGGESILRRAGTLIEASLHLGEDSLLIVFELPPYVHEIMDAVGAVKSRGGFVVVVTDRPVCPLLQHADLSFCCATDAHFFGNSLVAPLAFVNLLTSQVIYRMKDRVMDRLEAQQATFKNDRYYL